MNKEEIIERAYMNIFKNIFFTDIQKGIDENGWYSNERNNYWLPIQTEFSELDFKNNKELRPKSLQGLENNNGWIKIESEDDLPEEQMFLECAYKVAGLLKQATHHFMPYDKKYMVKNYTHYKPLPFNPPLH